MKNIISPEMTRYISKKFMKIKEHSPQVLYVTGTTVIIGGTVMACRNTIQFNKELEEYADGVKQEKMTKKDARIQTLKSAAKNYAIPAAVIASGVALTACGQATAMAELSAATAATAAVNKMFKDYRQNVIDEYGEEVDRRMMGLAANGEETITATDEVTGTVHQSDVDIIDKEKFDPISPYGFWVNETSKIWSGNTNGTVFMCKQYMRDINHRFTTKGYLTLNEALDAFKQPPVKEGGRLGWVYDISRTMGSTYIDSGMMLEVNDDVNDDLCEGRLINKAFYMEFEPDGDIFEIMEELGD